MLLALCNLNPTVGAIRSNADKLIRFAHEADAKQCDIAVFSEMFLAGYPTEDLVLWPDFVAQQWQELLRIRDEFKSSKMMLAFGLAAEFKGKVHNCAALVQSGKVFGIVPKQELPTYNVFYEGRIFTPGLRGKVSKVHGVPFGDLLFDTRFGNLALEICEDLWIDDGPLMSRVKRGAELCINISASPWRLGIPEARRDLLKSRSKAANIPIIYVNQFGGNDCLVFDGSSLIADKGEILLETPRWKEDMSVVVFPPDRGGRGGVTSAHEGQVPLSPPFTGGEGGVPYLTGGIGGAFDDLISALKLGISDYFDKTGAFNKIGIALSGGKDSALALLLAWDIFEARGESGVVNAFSMPTRFNSDVTKNIARELSIELGVNFTELSIEDAFAREVDATRAMSGREPDAMTLQNIQARIRALRMWNWSNTERGLWLQTGNMSEKSVGYTTIGGDLSGGYAPLANVPKTVVTALIAHYNERLKLPSLSALLATKASAELAPDQFDERDLMPYPVLDRCFELFAGKKLTLRETYEQLAREFSDEELKGLDPAYKPGQLKEWVKKFGRLFVLSIYKWVQAPEGVHVSDLDFDRDRALQLPVVQSLEWLKLDEL